MASKEQVNEDKQRAVELRLSGYTYTQIVEQLGGSVSLDQCKRLLKGIKPTPMKNTIKEQFVEEWYGRDYKDTWPLWIDDIVTGVSRLDWYGDRDNQIPLSTMKIINCFLWLDDFTVGGVKELLECGDKMATRYYKACRLCLPFMKRSLDNEAIRTMKYPRKQIVTTGQYATLGYLE
jgi:hypothetical protein